MTKVIHGGDDPEDARSVIAHYLDALASDLAGLGLGEIDVSATEAGRQPLQLADVYVPLDTHLRVPQDTTLALWLSSSRHSGRSDMGEPRRHGPVRPRCAGHPSRLPSGKLGSGKSTFRASVRLDAGPGMAGPRRARQTGRALDAPRAAAHPRILRRFAEQLPAGDQPARAGDLWGFIGRDLDASGYGLSPDTMKYVERIARTHGALILLDGLDECGTGARRQRVACRGARDMRSAGPKSRFLITARPYAWPGGPDPGRGVYALADFNDEQIEHFVRAWYAALVTRKWLSPGEADRKMSDLLGRGIVRICSRSPSTRCCSR